MSRATLESLNRWVRGAGTPDSHYVELFEQAPVPMHEIDGQGILTSVNETECRVLGYHREQLLGRPVWMLVDPDFTEESRANVLRKLRGEGDLSPFLRQYRASDGRGFVFEVHESYIRDEHGRVQGLRTALIDVTEKEDLRRRLAESAQRYKSRMIEIAGVGVLEVDPQDRILFANAAMGAICECRPEDLEITQEQLRSDAI
jgi:PAS domain S-box-containing protein